MILNKIILSFLTLIIFNGCDDGWDFDIPGCMNQDAFNFDSNVTIDNGSCSFQENQNEYIYTIDIDASEYNNWIYFSLNSGEVVDISNPENSLNWDLAFQRNHIRTNGGLSGIGNVCSIVDESQVWTSNSFESVQQISNGECEYDKLIDGDIFNYQGCYNPQTHIFESCIKNPALDKWGYFDDSYSFNVSNYNFFIKDIDGDYVKVWLINYYDVNGESGKISMSYLFLDK